MRKSLLLIIYIFINGNLFSQQFLSNSYNHKDYNAELKIWDAKQDSYGRMWFANNEGIIRFDGSNWTTFKTPNPARHIAFSKTGDLYIACLGDFGILEFKPDGTTEYISILNKNSFADKKTGNDENVFVAGEDVYFYMRNHLVSIKKSAKEYKTVILPTKGELVGGLTDGKNLYINTIDQGLGIIQNGNFIPYPAALQLKNYDIVGGIYNTKGLEIFTYYDGVFNFKDGLTAPSHSALNSFAKNGVTAFCSLKNQQYVVGTFHDGVKIFNSEGVELYTLLLPSNEIYSMYPDDAGNLWVGHAKGITHILLNSRIKSFPNIDLEGFATDIVSQNGNIYIASSGGVSVINANLSHTQVAGAKTECWDLYTENEILLVATSNGLFQIKDNVAKLLGEKEIFTHIQKGNISGIIYAFSTTGCYKYSIVGNEVKQIGKLDKLSEEATSLYENPDKSMWIGTRLSGLLKYPEMKSVEHAELKTGKIYILIKEGKPLFQSKNNIYILEGSDFKKEVQLSQTFGGIENKNNILSNSMWLYTKNRLKHIVNSKMVEHSPAYSITEIPTAVCEYGENLWMAFEDKVYRMVGVQTTEMKPKTTISLVKLGDASIAHSGIFFDIEGNPVLVQNTSPKIDYNNNDIRIEFGINSFINPQGNTYRYKIDELHSHWSEWQKESYLELNGLASGGYTLHVEARDAEGKVADEIIYKFRIMSPWYLSWWAIIIYIVLFFIVLYMLIKLYNRTLVKANEKLDLTVKERTAELSRTIESLKTTQEQLVQSEKLAALGQMTAGIAHEIQNPLNFVTNFSKLSQDLITDFNESSDETERKEIGEDLIKNLQKINEHGHRASSIVKNMLEHSRNNSGEKQMVAINDLCSEYIKLAFQSAKANSPEFHCKISQHLDPSVPQVNIVQQDISRVLLNLFNNALYAVNEKQKKDDSSYMPEVSVSSELLNKYIVLKIHDNGMGIPQKTKEKIFEPFFSTKPSGSGTGLGLSLSYDIIKAHNGVINVDSEEGLYTEFTLTLPL